MITDPIADFLTRIRNAAKAGHKVVEIPASKLKLEMTKILVDQGYALSYKMAENEGPQGTIKIALKYDAMTKQPAFRGLTRVSKPGLRQYVNTDSMPRVKNGLGIAIVSTSKGVMTDKQARASKVGGEVLCYVY
ncbi:MAG: 30S ribosomal protein S8 [Flavobacteriia bacterium]|nr:30S ribosomal protein S8 [Flavobacteriia bacterium]